MFVIDEEADAIIDLDEEEKKNLQHENEPANLSPVEQVPNTSNPTRPESQGHSVTRETEKQGNTDSKSSQEDKNTRMEEVAKTTDGENIRESVTFQEESGLAATNRNENDNSDSSQTSEHSNGLTQEQHPASGCCCSGCGDSATVGRHFFFRWYNIILAFLGVVVFYLDILTDITLVILFFKNQQWIYGGVTLAFISIFYVFAAVFFRHNWLLPTHNWPRWLKYSMGSLMVVMGPFNMPLLLAGFQVWFWRKNRSADMSLEERGEVEEEMKVVVGGSALYRLLQVFMQSAPQLVWQLYVIIVSKQPLLHSTEGLVQTVAVLSSLINLVLVQAVFNDVDRNYLGSREALSRLAQFFNFLWRLVQTSGRVLSIALFASVFIWPAVAVLLAHWLLMAVWYFKKLNPYYHRLVNRAFTSVSSGYFSIFSHFVFAAVRPSRFWHVVLGAIIWVENMLMLGLWFYYTPDQGTLFHTWGFVAVLWHMPVQLVMQTVYFQCCHSSSRFIHLCTPCGCSVWKRMLCESDWSETVLSFNEIFPC